jgi:hypothetical protein
MGMHLRHPVNAARAYYTQPPSPAGGQCRQLSSGAAAAPNLLDLVVKHGAVGEGVVASLQTAEQGATGDAGRYQVQPGSGATISPRLDRCSN